MANENTMIDFPVIFPVNKQRAHAHIHWATTPLPMCSCAGKFDGLQLFSWKTVFHTFHHTQRTTTPRQLQLGLALRE